MANKLNTSVYFSYSFCFVSSENNDVFRVSKCGTRIKWERVKKKWNKSSTSTISVKRVKWSGRNDMYDVWELENEKKKKQNNLNVLKGASINSSMSHNRH